LVSHPLAGSTLLITRLELEGALWFRANVGRRLSLGGRPLIGA
jgi:hypothetical protein